MLAPMIDLTWRESLSLEFSRRLTWLVKPFGALARSNEIGRIERDVIWD